MSIQKIVIISYFSNYFELQYSRLTNLLAQFQKMLLTILI